MCASRRPRSRRSNQGESATFTCPFRALIGHPINDDPDIVRRSEIYFHAEYDVPFWRSFRIPHDSAHFFFDTRPIAAALGRGPAIGRPSPSRNREGEERADQ